MKIEFTSTRIEFEYRYVDGERYCSFFIKKSLCKLDFEVRSPHANNNNCSKSREIGICLL